MFKTLYRISYRVPDLDKAKQWYSTVLELAPALDSPFYVVFKVGSTALTLMKSESTTPAAEQIVAFWEVDDIEAAYRRLLDLGASVRTEISTSVNTRIAKVIDPFGNVIGLESRTADAQKLAVENQPSESALTVAFCRALAAKDEREEIRGPDYLAEIFLTEDRRRPLKDRASREWVIQKLTTPELYHYFIARTAFLDQVFSRALQENIPQIVFLGAGYDTRSYRYRNLIRDSRIFEMDIPPTQKRKKDLLEHAAVPMPANLHFVPINFKTDAIEPVLLKAGFNKAARTLFIWEGVTYYLSAEAIDKSLKSVGALSSAGSTIAFDYMTQAVPSIYSGEPFQFWLPTTKIEAFLFERGFSVIEHLLPADLEMRYLRLRDGASVGKSLAFFAMVLASIRGERG